jgi:hypothetical protein
MGALFCAGFLHAEKFGTNMVRPGIPAVLLRIAGRHVIDWRWRRDIQKTSVSLPLFVFKLAATFRDSV